MFNIPKDKKDWVRRYIPNYPIYILDARHLPDEQIEQFGDELRLFFYMIRENYDEKRIKGRVARLRETWYAISAVRNDNRYVECYNRMQEESADGGVRMDAVLDRLVKRGEERGIMIGEKRGIEIGEDNGVAMSAKVFKMVRAGERDNKVIAEKCGYTVEQVQKIRKELEI